MAFRSERDASRHRIEALEDQLEEQDAELERLRAEVAKKKQVAQAKRAKQKPSNKKPSKNEGSAVPVVAPADLPKGDRWALRCYSAWWMVPVGGAALAVLLLALGVGAEPGQPTLRWLVMWLLVAPLAVAVNKTVVLDRKQGRVTAGWGPLRSACKGKAFEVRGYVHSSENGPGVKWGRVCFGNHRLMAERQPKASTLAQRMAAFMSLPYAGSKSGGKEQERAALGPLIGTFGLAALFGAALGLAHLLGLY